MYLKSLTLRGFKSFASATTLRLEPGITCVVGPNGSGKSNVVDALSWVMGEQGAKSLRGGKMEDVIFAGTTNRAPLGRAEVALTIDNSDGALPIDYAEVTISRLMFRSGQSEYAINGDSCRLLDVQDLLSDSGLGREMHVIVGQGQLDQILHAGPEARRAIIEEAAGVLKHRKRKEKALRKLDAMQANLTRLVDLTSELSRRLKPLGRQAEMARKAAVIQADLRDARLRLLADDYMLLHEKMIREAADEAAIRARRAQLEASLGSAREREAELDAASQAQALVLGQAQQTWFQLSSLTEKLRSVQGLAEERVRLLGAEQEPERPGRDPDELDRQAEELRAEESGLTERLGEGQESLAEVVAERTAAESALAAAERRLADAARAAAGRAERLARLRGMTDAAESRSAAAAEEIERLAEAAEQARARAERARLELSEVQDVAEDGDSDRSDLAAELAAAQEEHQAHAERVSAARKAERAANSEVAALRARVEALGETLRQGVDATAAVLADPGRFHGVLGSFAAQLSVADGYQKAIAAALGAAAEALTVNGLDAAVDVLAGIRTANAGTVGLVIAAPGQAQSTDKPGLPGTARWAAGLVTAPAGLSGAVADLLGDVAVFADLTEAAEFVRNHPDCRAVTADGDLIGTHWARGGSAGGQSLLDVRAAADEAAAKLAAAELAAQESAELLAAASEAADGAQEKLGEIRQRMQAVDAAKAEISGRLGRLAGAARAAADEAKRIEASVGAAQRGAEKDQVKLVQLKDELAEAEAAELGSADPEAENQLAGEEREELANRAAAARNAEMEARLEVRTVEERLRAIGGRADSLAAAATAERTARERAAVRRRQRAAQASVARAVAAGAAVAVSAAEESLAESSTLREEAEQSTARGTEALKSVRAQVTAISGELDKVVDTAHGTEITRNEHRLRLEQLAEHAADEYGIEPDALLAEYGPGVPVQVPVNSDAAKRARAANTIVPDLAEDPGAAQAPDEVPAAAQEPLSLADALRAVRVEASQDDDEDSPAAPLAAEQPKPETVGIPYVRAEQEARAAEAERQLARLGKINPLALEEYTALQERHQFLATQLDDLRKTRRDLLMVVKEVDDRVQEVFASAYADTAREFEGLFSRLFPGGSGRLILTEPDDMLTTGIEIEARPPGKKVKRLSLLSGGERSLTAIAYLTAIFKARPSPFYVLDEVEAALDDTNLQRLLRVFEELRETSQLIVITHQRRTMESADALYGVSMRGDGVSQVISQRVRESEPA
ncbi:chromosome segregation protein SMC [Trebonia kvetii]|uniref:Chromosome partition protein Smc n=1 Tax=Trebonia kvetii TaxID=2480626 RepID=A0A6P2CA68_9ACTN|nr:chromosome segregation protein SMC [Trebonia kvetii]TVZ06453.1 chromosome segregation protein SMC [Trebonia kvetii]